MNTSKLLMGFAPVILLTVIGLNQIMVQAVVFQFPSTEHDSVRTSSISHPFANGSYILRDHLLNGSVIERGPFSFNDPTASSASSQLVSTATSKPLGEYAWITGPCGVYASMEEVLSDDNDNYFLGPSYLFENDGYGHVSPTSILDVLSSITYSSHELSMSRALDVDMDSYLDIIVPTADHYLLQLINPLNQTVRATIYDAHSEKQNIEAFQVLDFDGDGYAEYVILVTDYSVSAAILVFVDDITTGFTILRSQTILSNTEYADVPTFSLSITDLDADGKLEFLIDYKPRVGDGIITLFLDDQDENFTELVSTDLGISLSSFSPLFLDEETKSVELAMYPSGGSNFYLGFLRYNYSSHELTVLHHEESGSSVALYSFKWARNFIYTDVTFDASPELIIFNENNLELYNYSQGVLSLLKTHRIFDYVDSSSPLQVEVHATNMDADLDTELVLVYQGLYAGSSTYYSGVVVLDDFLHEFAQLSLVKLKGEAPSHDLFSTLINPEGSMLVKYDHYNQSISKPYIISVMAAPPTVNHIGQNYGDSLTLFGQAASSTVTEGNGYTISNSATLSYESPDLFNIFKVEASVTISKELDRTVTSSQTVEKITEHTGDYSNDYVLFELVTYDNFYYTVLKHPNETMVGTQLAISIPVHTQINKWIISYFNDHNGQYPDLTYIFNHTIGDITSYMTKNDVEHLEQRYTKSGFWKNGPITVGSGYGSVAVEIAVENTYTTSTVYTLGTTIEAGVTAFGVGLKYSRSLSKSSIFEVTVGSSTTYRGQVGDIAPYDYEDFNYDFGLVVYNYNDTNYGLSYQILNYWVENYAGGTPDVFHKLAANMGVSLYQFYGIGAGTLVLILALGIWKLKPKKKKKSKR